MNILLLGLGSIAQKHIQALQELDVRAEIYALRSGHVVPPPGGRGIGGGGQVEELPSSTSVLHSGIPPLPGPPPSGEGKEDVISVFDVADVPRDVAFAMICTPTHVHAKSIAAALQFRCSLFVEKPLVRHLSEIDPVLKAVDAAGVSTHMACHLRHHPCLHYVWDHLKDRRVKSVRAYCGSYLPDWVPGKDWKKSFRANKEQSGGVHLELIHELDYVTWMFGMPRKSSATLKNTGALGIDVIDDARYDLTYDGFSAVVEVNYHRRDPKRTLGITFDDGSWTVDLLNFCITDENGKIVFQSGWSIADVYREQMRYFLECLESGRAPMNSVHEAASVLRIALANERDWRPISIH